MIAAPAAQGRRLTLVPADVHLWSADLDELGDSWIGLLSDPELRRSETIISPAVARRWGRGRGLLRGLLGSYLDVDPRELALDSGPNGKPRLSDFPDGAPGFNLSHSGSLVIYAFTGQGDVGIDLQLPREGVDHLALAARTLGPEVAAELCALEPVARRRAFLRAWTRHEAGLKWSGEGIWRGDSDPLPAPWMADLRLGCDAVGALALDTEPARLSSTFAGAGPLAQVAGRGPGGPQRGTGRGAPDPLGEGALFAVACQS